MSEIKRNRASFSDIAKIIRWMDKNKEATCTTSAENLTKMINDLLKSSYCVKSVEGIRHAGGFKLHVKHKRHNYDSTLMGRIEELEKKIIAMQNQAQNNA